MASWKDDVLFLGMGRDGVSHYRTYLPATRGGFDWATQDTDGTMIQEHVSHKEHGHIVYQMPFHPFQIQQMLAMQDHGATVILNLDDDLRAVRNMKHEHGLSHHFHKKLVQLHEAAVKAADHLIVSTDWLAERYRHPSTFVCRNGLDLPRYEQKAVESPFDLTIGWSGGTGHEMSVREIAPAISEFIRETDGAGLFIVGEPRVGDLFDLPKDKMAFKMFMDLHLYPSYVKAFDIGLAPAADHDFFRAKSELRFYEYGAAGVAGIYSPITYGTEAAELGMDMAQTGDEVLECLHKLSDKEYRDGQAARAREYVAEYVDMEVRVGEWEEAIRTVVSP